MDRVCRKGDGLFPSPQEIKLSCSCPDWAEMCKHVAAVLYGVERGPVCGIAPGAGETWAHLADTVLARYVGNTLGLVVADHLALQGHLGLPGAAERDVVHRALAGREHAECAVKTVHHRLARLDVTAGDGRRGRECRWRA